MAELISKGFTAKAQRREVRIESQDLAKDRDMDILIPFASLASSRLRGEKQSLSDE
jgi:uncharacterized protein (UPF0335 family)